MEYQDLESPTQSLHSETDSEDVAVLTQQKSELKRRHLVSVDDGIGNVCYQPAKRESLDLSTITQLPTPPSKITQNKIPLILEPTKDIPLLAERSRREREKQSFVRRHCMVDSIWVVLALLGALASILGFLIDEVVIGLQALQSEWMSLGNNFAGAWCLWISWKIFFVLLAVLVTRGSPAAAGSGIPEMKAILAGFPIPNYLSFRTLIVKFFGLAFALGSGLGVGKEGPFIHICGIIANQLMSFNCFRGINRSTLRNQVMAAAVGVGVSATFGAPVGGVMFGIEVTSTYYSVASYWKSIFAAIVGAVVFGQLAVLGHDTAFNLFWTNFESAPYKANEMWLFILLAIICGLAASLFVKFRKFVLIVRKKYQVRFFGRGPFIVSIVVSFVCAIWEFPFGCPMLIPLRKAANDLFHSSDLYGEVNLKDLSCSWNEPIPLFASVIMFVVLRFLFTGIIMTLPIPCGIITPVFAVGAGIGRLFGEIMHLIDPEITAGGYAVVGAASFTAGVTGTISIAVIVFELTAQLSYMHPILLGVVIGRKCGSLFGVSIFDSIADKQGLPFMPFLNKQKSYLREAWEVMQPIETSKMCPRVLKRDDIPPFLQWDHEAATVPVVDSLSNHFFLGCVSVPVLLELYNDRKLWHLPPINQEVQDSDSESVSSESHIEGSEATLALPLEEKRHVVTSHRVEEVVSIDLVERNVMSLKSLRVPHTTPLHDVIAFFSLHRCGRVFVTTGHAVVGYVDLSDLQKHSVDGLL